MQVGGGGYKRGDVVGVVVEERGNHVGEIARRDGREVVFDGEGAAVFFGGGADLLEELQEGWVLELAVESLDEDAVDAVFLHPAEMRVDDAGAVGFEELGRGSGGEEEVGGEEAFLGVLFYGGEHVELHFVFPIEMSVLRSSRIGCVWFFFSLTITGGAWTGDLAEFDHPVIIPLPWAPEEALVSK